MRNFRIGTFCGARWYRRSDWRKYPLFKIRKDAVGLPMGFSVGPILIWDGS